MVMLTLEPSTLEVCLKRQSTFGAWLGVFALLISACSSAGQRGKETATPAPEAVFTSAAQTAEALRIERFAQTATLPVEAIISTSAFASPTVTLQPSEPVPTQSSPTGAVPAASQPAAGGERGEFVADVSIPDGTILVPNQAFQKTWRIMNAGQTTWTTDYSLVYIDGALMGAQPSVSLPASVEPGAKVEITIDMVAPPDVGSYRGYWKMRNAVGQVFGFGANADEAIWVDVVVEGESASAAQTTTPGAGGVVASVSLGVDNAVVSGACPHTFVFTARISLSGPTTLKYLLEGGSLSGENVRLPLPTTQTLESGTHPVVYQLTVPTDTIAWARLHVTDPVNVFSNQVDFSLNCG